MKRHSCQFTRNLNARVYQANEILVKNGRTTLRGNVTINGKLFRKGVRYDRAGLPVTIK